MNAKIQRQRSRMCSRFGHLLKPYIWGSLVKGWCAVRGSFTYRYSCKRCGEAIE